MIYTYINIFISFDTMWYSITCAASVSRVFIEIDKRVRHYIVRIIS